MSHHIEGFIADGDQLRRVATEFSGARVVQLSIGFGFLPVTKELARDDDAAPFPHLIRLTAKIGAWAESKSRMFPLAYIETDYFGGHGCRAAMAWIGGKVFGPFRTSDLREGRQFVPTPLLEGAINRILRLIGVDRASERDEFDALGLGRYRSNECWLSKTASE